MKAFAKAPIHWVLVVLVVSGCSGSGSTPASPTSAGETVASLTIVGPDMVRSGETATYAVTAKLTDGTVIANASPVVWTTDRSSVATISDQGHLTAHEAGVTTVTATYSGKTATTTVRVPASTGTPGVAGIAISFEPEPATGSNVPCSGAFWGGQTPTWRTIETTRETQGVGFTLTGLTYSFYNKDGALTRTAAFRLHDYMPPYSEEVEDGCMALAGSPSGSFEEILQGIDDNEHELTFTRQLRLPPVAP